MSLIPVPSETFAAAKVQPMHGFEFLYDPEDSAYGVAVRAADSTLPQALCFVEVGRVGAALQLALYGEPARQVTKFCV